MNHSSTLLTAGRRVHKLRSIIARMRLARGCSRATMPRELLVVSNVQLWPPMNVFLHKILKLSSPY